MHAFVEDADVPRDFDDVDATITIPAGELVGYVDVLVHGDTIDEGDTQDVYVDLTELTGGATFPGGFTDSYPFAHGQSSTTTSPSRRPPCSRHGRPRSRKATAARRRCASRSCWTEACPVR